MDQRNSLKEKSFPKAVLKMFVQGRNVNEINPIYKFEFTCNGSIIDSSETK